MAGCGLMSVLVLGFEGRLVPTSPGFAMASTLRKLKSLVLSHTTDTEQITNLLETASVPLHTGDCRSCSDPCTEGTSYSLLDSDFTHPEGARRP